jgi:hypothetical protein
MPAERSGPGVAQSPAAGAPAAGAPAAGAPPTGTPAAGGPLAEVQGRLYDLITAPEGVAKRLAELGRPPGDLETMVRSSGALSAVERVDVYANMYFFRILEVLADEYAKVVTLMGDDAFHNLVTDYLLACRPAHPSLREVGARLPAFLAEHPLCERRPWLSELAQLERLRLELFDGPDAEALTLDAVRALGPEALPELPLHAIPCRAVLGTQYAITGLWRALEGHPEEDEATKPLTKPPTKPPTQALAQDPVRAPAKEPESILVWRQHLTVFHRVLDPDEASCLSMLSDGTTFAAVCEHVLDAAPDAQAAAQRSFELLGRWLNDGVLTASLLAPVR